MTRRAASVRNWDEAYPRPLESATRARRSRLSGSEAEHRSHGGQRGEQRAQHPLAGARVPEGDAPPGVPVGAERLGGRLDVAADRGAGAVGRGVGAVDGRVAPHQAGAGQVERAQRRGDLAEGEERGAQVVLEAGERDLPRAHRAARLFLGFEHQHAQAGAGEVGRRREAVGAGSDDDASGMRSGLPCARAGRRRAREREGARAGLRAHLGLVCDVLPGPQRAPRRQGDDRGGAGQGFARRRGDRRTSRRTRSGSTSTAGSAIASGRAGSSAGACWRRRWRASSSARRGRGRSSWWPGSPTDSPSPPAGRATSRRWPSGRRPRAEAR